MTAKTPTFAAFSDPSPYLVAYLSRDEDAARAQIEQIGDLSGPSWYCAPSRAKEFGVPGAGHRFRASDTCAERISRVYGCNVYHIQGVGGGLYIAEIPESSPALPSKAAPATVDISATMKVIFMRAIPAGLTFRDVIGMGPDRPTWEQVKMADLIVVDIGTGVNFAYKTADLF